MTKQKKHYDASHLEPGDSILKKVEKHKAGIIQLQGHRGFRVTFRGCLKNGKKGLCW